MALVALDALGPFARAALTARGVPGGDAGIVADSIRYAHAHGKHTHGIGRLPIYIKRLDAGLMQPETPLAELSAAPAMALLDAADGFGQVAGVRGMDRAIAMARQGGVGMVGIRHSHNFGTAAFLAAHAVEAGMGAMVFSNSAPALAPTGGTRPVFGTNPMAFGFPAPDGRPPVILDMATSQAARGKIRLAATNGERIPLGWAMDADGNPTEDPEAALAGALLPVGGAKGYGLSLMIDVLAGLLTGSGFAGGANNLDNPDGPQRCGHLLLAIDIARFADAGTYDARMRTLIEATHGAGAPGAVFLPGERGGHYMEGREGRVPLSDAVLARLDTLAGDCGLDPMERL